MVETAWLTAEQVMTSPAEVVAAEAPVLYAVGVLDRSGFSQLPVVNAEGLVVGTFRARDVRRLYWQLGQMLAADGGDVATELARRQVGQMCSEPLPQVRPDAGLSEVIARVEKWHAVLVGPMDKRWGIITSGDLLRVSKPYLLLAELEVRLRHFIELQLSRLTPKWWQQRIPTDVQHRCEQRQVAVLGQTPPALADQDASLLAFCGFPDYLEIILERNNWSDVFMSVFGSREWVIHRLKDLQDLRNAVAHHRPLSAEELDLLDAYVEAFLRCFGGGSR
ncbi:MAG: CBS domain-containing protein [Limnochordaceae bacterium]|nr:CBS domain-containing protein [Limnochordaceae bacterium]